MRNPTQKLLLLFLLTLLISTSVKGQQISLFNHYYYNPTLYNPAFTGNKETTNIMLVSKDQWTGFKGSPKLNILSVDGSILKRKMGIGVSVFSETKGINKTIGGNLLSSYRININHISHLNFGISLRILSHNINFSEAVVEDVSDPTFYSSSQTKTSFDGNIGLAYFWKELEVGISLNQILKSKSVFSNDIENDISYTPSYHYINSVKYKFTLNKAKQILIAPQALVRYIPNAPLQYELNTNLYLNKFWVGAAYKNDYAIAVNAGVSLFKKFDVGYSYDIITSDIGQNSGISHELMLNFKFGKRKKKERIKEEPELEKKEEPTQEKELLQETIEEVVEEPTQKEDPFKEIKEEVMEEPTQNENLEEIETENGVRIIKGSVDDFENTRLQTAKKGVYVVVGTFSYRELAIKYALKLKLNGYPQASFIYSEDENYNYVYMFMESSKKDALDKINEAKENGSSQAWILILTD